MRGLRPGRFGPVDLPREVSRYEGFLAPIKRAEWLAMTGMEGSTGESAPVTGTETSGTAEPTASTPGEKTRFRPCPPGVLQCFSRRLIGEGVEIG